MDLELTGKNVLITGANGGIGAAITRAFLEEGANVIAIYRGEASKVQFLHDWVNQHKPAGQLETHKVDIAVELEVDQLAEQLLQSHAQIDVLINNAGNLIEKPFLITEDADWDSLLEVHLRGNVVLTRAIAKQMLLNRSGTIVNITSVVGSAWGRGVSAYASIKAAINRLTQILAVELGKKGIRVNAVAPGLIDTNMSKMLQARAQDTLSERILLDRLGVPEDVANAVLFLASNRCSSYITGHILTVDGGVSL